MKTIGLYLVVLGAFSIILHFLSLQLSILAWIDDWGESTGWGIRIGMIVVGIILMFIGGKKEPEASE